jgi:hypothetical protein
MGIDRSVHAEDYSSNQMFAFWDRVARPLFNELPKNSATIMGIADQTDNRAA